MAGATFFFKDAVPAGAVLHRSLSRNNTAPAAATTTTGWNTGTNASGQACLQKGGTEVGRADATWSTTLRPSAAPSTTVGDAWRSESQLTGTFQPGTWTFTFQVRSVTAAYTGRFKLAVRVWRDPDGNAGTPPTEMTSARVASAATTASLSTTVDTQIQFTWTQPTAITLTGEYLYINVGIEITSAGGGTTQDMDFRVGSTATVVTSDFGYNESEAVTATDAVSATVTPGVSANPFIPNWWANPLPGKRTYVNHTWLQPALHQYDGSVSESVTAAETVDAAVTAAPNPFVPNWWANPLPGKRTYVNHTWLQPALHQYADSVSEAGSADDAVSATVTPAPSPFVSNWWANPLPGKQTFVNHTWLQPALHQYADSVSEVGSATDAVSSAVIFAGSISETGSGADAITASADFASSVSETGTAADAPSAVAVFPASYTEATTASDSFSGPVVFAGSLSESGTAADALSSVTDFVSSITESGAVSDSLSCSVTATRDVSESGNADDALTGAAVFSASIAESSTATDATSNTTDFSPSISEAGSVSDDPTSTADFVSSLSEALTGTDAVSNITDYTAALSESASGSDALTGAGDYPGEVIEAGSISDALTGAVEFAASISESGSSSDVLVGGLVTAGSDDVSEAASAADVLSAAVDYLVDISETESSADYASADADYPVSILEGGLLADAFSAAVDAGVKRWAFFLGM